MTQPVDVTPEEQIQGLKNVIQQMQANLDAALYQLGKKDFNLSLVTQQNQQLQGRIHQLEANVPATE